MNRELLLTRDGRSTSVPFAYFCGPLRTLICRLDPRPIARHPIILPLPPYFRPFHPRVGGTFDVLGRLWYTHYRQKVWKPTGVSREHYVSYSTSSPTREPFNHLHTHTHADQLFLFVRFQILRNSSVKHRILSLYPSS